MVKVLFVCHGNICRSPMGEFLFRELCRRAGLADCISAASRAASREEEGAGLYPQARTKLREKGIPIGPHRATLITPRDYREADYILAMDRRNLQELRRVLGGDPAGKVHLLLEYDGGGEIADPWYTGDFETAYQDILRGCEAFLRAIAP